MQYKMVACAALFASPELSSQSSRLATTLADFLNPTQTFSY